MFLIGVYSPYAHIVKQTPNPNVKISLHNQGYGFGFTVKEAEDRSIVVSKVFPKSVAHTVGHVMIVLVEPAGIFSLNL